MIFLSFGLYYRWEFLFFVPSLMKNKILSYSFWLFISICFAFWYVHADCADQCKNAGNATEYETCIGNCASQQQKWWCGGAPYCCDGDPSSIPCDKIPVITGCMGWCCWIKLNTNFPIIWNCIETKSDEANPTNAFPYMMWALTKIIMSLIMVVCFILVIVSGIMRAWDKPKEWKELLKKVAITILLLWFSWVILRLINPNFFG